MCAKNYKNTILNQGEHLRIDRVVVNELNEFLGHFLNIRYSSILLHVIFQKLDHLSVKQIIESSIYSLLLKSH